MSTEVAVIERETSIVRPAGSPREISEAIYNYKKIQEELDKAMPDCIQHIAGKAFRKKNYWRAVKTAFNLSVEMLREDRITLGDDWGYIVTYRATAPNKASADGDGACTYSEKGKGNMIPSLHNIRSQAHTRAFNRAVSNLVGFGEVSAEEVIEEKEQQRAGQKAEPVREPVQPKQKEEKKVLSKKGKFFWAQLCKAYTTESGEPDKAVIKEAIVELTGKPSLFECSDEEIQAGIDKLQEAVGEDATS